MNIIFGTTNKRKVEDLQNIVNELNYDINVLSMKDIGWDRGEIEEDGLTIEENSLIKANAIKAFCNDNNIDYPIITDDTGLFCDILNGEPGVYTTRYADDELAKDSSLPKYQCVIKLIRNLKDKPNRNAQYKCCITCMMKDGTYFQEIGVSNGHIIEEIPDDIRWPYFYSVFILDKYNKVFNDLTEEELKDTYRYKALTKTLNKINRGV